MIISDRIDKSPKDFEQILLKSKILLREEAKSNESYFSNRSAIDFEIDVFNSLCQAAKGSAFSNNIILISGHKFPDITISNFYGVEVKTSKNDHWKSTGNSILESTRIENIEKVYLFFGKLTTPVDFKYRLYQECLYDIAVTHSPRYLINMLLKDGDSIFDRIGIGYDALRKHNNPIKPILEYYRSISKPGEEPWWMDNSDSIDNLSPPTVSLWNILSADKKKALKNQSMALFPELFSQSNTKYQRLAAWLAARHGIVDYSLRDRFSAGGRINLRIEKTDYTQLPRIFLHLYENISEIVDFVKSMPPDEAQYYWGLKYKPQNRQQLLTEWANQLVISTNDYVLDSRKFVVHLLGANLNNTDCPLFIRESQAKYGL